MGKYCRLEDVQARLRGKVRFTDNTNDEGRMLNSLANTLIAEAESQVEQDFSPRYMAPFQTTDGLPFNKLPDGTRLFIRTMAEIQSVLRILETDFGAGTAIDAEKYSKNIEKRYKKMLDENVLKKVDGKADSRQWFFPPFPGLRKNYFNTEADDGYAGVVLVTSQFGDRGDYPSGQINDPSENFWSGHLDDE